MDLAYEHVTDNIILVIFYARINFFHKFLTDNQVADNRVQTVYITEINKYSKSRYRNMQLFCEPSVVLWCRLC